VMFGLTEPLTPRLVIGTGDSSVLNELTLATMAANAPQRSSSLFVMA
jgi:hypothetical protein